MVEVFRKPEDLCIAEEATPSARFCGAIGAGQYDAAYLAEELPRWYEPLSKDRAVSPFWKPKLHLGI